MYQSRYDALRPLWSPQSPWMPLDVSPKAPKPSMCSLALRVPPIISILTKSPALAELTSPGLDQGLGCLREIAGRDREVKVPATINSPIIQVPTSTAKRRSPYKQIQARKHSTGSKGEPEGQQLNPS